MDECFRAAVESVEEAIWNSVVAAQTVIGRDGNTLHALPHDDLRRWLAHYRPVPG
jgi:L-aminopeptidase/D-esterase-like protein